MRKLTLLAELLDFKPRIWRRIEISEENSIEDLMDTMLIIFNTDVSHIYHLEIPTKLNDFIKENTDERGKLLKRLPTGIDSFKQIYRGNFFKSKFNYEVITPEEVGYVDEFNDDYDDGYDPRMNFKNYQTGVIDFMNYKLQKEGKNKIRKKNNPLDKLKSLNLDIAYEMYFKYDYGADWTFKIKVEKISDNLDDLSLIPRVLRGRCIGIIDDLGGSYYLKDLYDTSDEFKEFFPGEINQELRSIF